MLARTGPQRAQQTQTYLRAYGAQNPQHGSDHSETESLQTITARSCADGTSHIDQIRRVVQLVHGNVRYPACRVRYSVCVRSAIERVFSY